jgi:hypothetical protein
MAKSSGIVLVLVAVAALLVWMTPKPVLADRSARSRQPPLREEAAPPTATASSSRS